VVAHCVRNRLFDPQVLQQCLDRQNSSERELFHQILHKNGACVWRDLLDGGLQKKFNHARADLLEELTNRSGLVYVWQAGANKYNNMIVVPRDMSHMIQNGFRRDERTLEELNHGISAQRSHSNGASFHPSVILDNSHNILRDLAILLAWVRRNPTKMLNNGGIGRNDLKKIAPMLSHNKTLKYAAFLALFAMTRKLVIPAGGQWRVSKNVGPFLRNSAVAFREIYEFWLNANEWNEEFIEGDIVHVDNYPQNLVSITELRKLVLRVLENVPVESWIDFETFAESLLPQIAIEIPGRFDHMPHDRNNRHTILIVESIVAESLYWLGLVTLGVPDLEIAAELGSRTNEALAPFDLGQAGSPLLLGTGGFSFCFKPTQQGRETCGGKYLEPQRIGPKGTAEAAAPDGTVSFTVQPNLEIVTPPDCNLEKFFQLLAFTDVKKVDIMTTLVLSRESLRMGMEAGWGGPQILEFLRASSRRELPETVVHLIEECGARHGEVDVGLAGGYIMAADPMHVEELRANPRIARYVKDVFKETLIIMNRTVDLKKVTAEIQKMGFMPHVASDTIHVTGEGLFHVTLRPAELYDMLALLRFCQGLEDEHEAAIFEGKVQALNERLGTEARENFNPSYFVEPLHASFTKNFEKTIGKKKDEEKKKLKKQVSRLLTRIPKAKEADRYAGENPTSDPNSIMKLIKYAIEHERQVKIHYQRSTGGEIDEVIEPESLQAGRVYAFCPEHDEHHIYNVKRILQAAI